MWKCTQVFILCLIPLGQPLLDYFELELDLLIDYRNLIFIFIDICVSLSCMNSYVENK